MARKNKSLDCQFCDETVHNVGEDAVKVTCSLCVTKSMQTGITILNDEDDQEDLDSNEFLRND